MFLRFFELYRFHRILVWFFDRFFKLLQLHGEVSLDERMVLGVDVDRAGELIVAEDAVDGGPHGETRPRLSKQVLHRDPDAAAAAVQVQRNHGQVRQHLQ